MKTDDVSVRVCVYITFEPTEQIPNKHLRNFFFNFFSVWKTTYSFREMLHISLIEIKIYEFPFALCMAFL